MVKGRTDERPRISNGVRRGLRHVITLALAQLKRPVSGQLSHLRSVELQEVARAVAWMEWHRRHNGVRREFELAARPARKTRRMPRPTATQTQLVTDP